MKKILITLVAALAFTSVAQAQIKLDLHGRSYSCHPDDGSVNDPKDDGKMQTVTFYPYSDCTGDPILVVPIFWEFKATTEACLKRFSVTRRMYEVAGVKTTGGKCEGSFPTIFIKIVFPERAENFCKEWFYEWVKQ